MEKTIQILKQTSDGLVLDTKLLFNILEKIGDKNIAIVSINGKQNSGKTFLLNYFLDYVTGKACNYFANELAVKRFDLSAGDRMTANGIWMWSEPIAVTADDGSEMVLLLMETKADIGEKDSYQESGVIFAISLLLSSTLILNIQNDLSEDMIKFVEYFSHFAQSLNIESKSELFQRLVFLVRDWDNESAYRYGYHSECTSNDNNFKKNVINTNTNQSSDEQNTRKRLLSLFGDISSYLMPHPGKNVTKPWFCGQTNMIEKVFVEKVEEFVQIIFGNLEPRIIDDQKLTGNSLKNYLNKWQEMISNNGKIEMNSLFPLPDETVLQCTFQNACNIYETRILSCFELNASDEELVNSHIIAQNESWSYVSTKLNDRVNDVSVNKMYESLGETIAKMFECYRNENLRRIENYMEVKYGICIARNVPQNVDVSNKPSNKVYLHIPCPGTYSGKCESQDIYWLCYKCREHLEYGFDGYFYCGCGKADVFNYQYKCISKNHSAYLQFTESQLKHLLSKKEVNILILGETGVGKSTWINGLVNYLTYPSLAEASRGELLSLIASTFTMTDNNYQRCVITCGEDKNEVFITGQSATQDPKSYVFEYENKLIRLIDTPGIGDTRGIDQDKRNFGMILKYLSNLEKLDGICILLKPNNARLTVMFRFCIKELLTHLHRDASRNIVFCFTNARSTFYRPGDTMPALETLLGENQEVEIKLSKDTIYCMDNESFRFLCAIHNGIVFDEEECINYSKSWDKSVNETKRMVEYICGLVPHSVSNTLSLNDTRNIIISLSKPLADITQNILTNINVVEDKKKEILCAEETEKGLIGKLFMDVIQLEANQLGYPRTVCTDQKCVTFHNIDGSSQYTTEFTTHCHPHCTVPGVKPESYPNPALKGCEAMAGTDNCIICGCNWEKHMHITYEQNQVIIKVIDEGVEELIKNKQTVRKGIELQIKNMEQFVKEINDEKDTITKVSAKFGGFLKANSIVPYNDALGEYLDFLIRIEKDKVSAGGDRKTLEGLEQMRKAYDEEVRMLDQYMKTGGISEHLSPIDMIDLVDKLYALKHKGRELKQIMQVMTASKLQMNNLQETNYKSKCKEKPKNFILKNIDNLKNVGKNCWNQVFNQK